MPQKRREKTNREWLRLTNGSNHPIETRQFPPNCMLREAYQTYSLGRSIFLLSYPPERYQNSVQSMVLQMTMQPRRGHECIPLLQFCHTVFFLVVTGWWKNSLFCILSKIQLKHYFVFWWTHTPTPDNSFWRRGNLCLRMDGPWANQSGPQLTLFWLQFNSERFPISIVRIHIFVMIC